MARISIRLFVILYALDLLASLGIIIYSVYLRYGGGAASADCGKFLQIPLLACGGFLLLLSVVGILGAWLKKPFLMVACMVLTAVAIVVLACLTIVVLVLTNQGAGEAVSNRGFKDHRLGNYKTWLGKRVQNDKTWKSIKSCLRGAKVCHGVDQKNSQGLSSIQSGCCQPPPDCNQTLSYVTTRNRPSLLFASSPLPQPSGLPADCTSWKNEESILCYDCQSCKDGFLNRLKGKSKSVAVGNSGVLGFYVLVLIVACFALKSVRAKGAPPPAKT